VHAPNDKRSAGITRACALPASRFCAVEASTTSRDQRKPPARAALPARACSELSTASSVRKAALRRAATGLASAVAASRRSSVCAAGDGAWLRPPAAAAAAASASALPASASDCAQAAEGTPYKLGLG